MDVSVTQIIKYMVYDWHRFQYNKKSWLKNNMEQLEKTALSLKKTKNKIDPDIPLKEIDFTVFDLETTGFFPRIGDEVVSIGALKMNIEKMQFAEHFYEVVRPAKKIPREIFELTGLTSKDIDGGIEFPLAFKHFLEFSEDTLLVAHPASFDVPFLQEMVQRWGLPDYQPPFIDSYEVARWLYPQEKNGLDQLIQKFAVDKEARHHALNDANMTAKLFERLLYELMKEGIETYKDWELAKKHRRK